MASVVMKAVQAWPMDGDVGVDVEGKDDLAASSPGEGAARAAVAGDGEVSDDDGAGGHVGKGKVHGDGAVGTLPRPVRRGCGGLRVPPCVGDD